ncbi:MAG: hypothetical protein WBG92_24135 [Thiohalocapsa sp.]
MLAIPHFFLELCLLKRTPQDLPASNALLTLVVVVGLLGGMLLSVTAGAAFLVGIGQTLLDFLIMLGALHLALKLTGKLPRFVQTATALVGADALVGFVALLPVGLAGPNIEDSPQLLLAGLMFMALVAWSVLVTAHILRHAFDIKLIQGAMIAVAFDILSFVVVGGLTQGSA